jgi:ABC-2 type transport system permease protein
VVRTLRAAVLVARNDLHRRLRSRAFLLQAFVGPIVLSVVISLAFGGSFTLKEKVGVVNRDHSALGEGVQRQLVGSTGGGLTFVALRDVATARSQVKDDTVDAAIVIPPGFQASLATVRPGSLQVVTDPGQQIGEAVATAVANGIAARVDAGRLATVTLLAHGRSAPSTATLLGLDLPVELRQIGAGETLSPAASVAPGMALLFLFLSVSFVARSLLEEKRLRVLDRICAAPVSLTGLLIGKAIGLILASVASVLVLWGVTAATLGAQWGDPVGVLLLAVAASISVAGVAGVVAAATTSEQTADLLATAIGFVFGILGGSLVPLAQLPPTLLRLSLFTPNGWALRGFAELSAGQGHAGDVLVHVVVLLAWGLVAGAIAAVLLPRRLGTR